MRSLHHTVESAIVSHRMLKTGDTVVLAVSGGPDSVCLLYVMAALAMKWHWQLHVAHLHHGIRGRDADEDASFVAELADAMGLPFHLRRCSVPELARSSGMGLEEAGRQARYQFFRDVVKDVGAYAVATGHHADDQAETVLMNLIRGAGGTGLSGMPLVRTVDNGLRVIRPLLLVTRSEIERYLKELGVTPRHDRSNDELYQTRNRIRHQLLPALKQFNPRVVEALTRTAEILRDDEQYLDTQADDFLRKHLEQRYGLLSLPASHLQDQPLALRRRIVRRMVDLVSWEAKQCMIPTTAMSPNTDASFSAVEGVLTLLQASSIKPSWSMSLPGGSTARLSQGKLFFLPRMRRQVEPWCLSWRGTGILELPGIGCRLSVSECARPVGGWDPRYHLDRGLLHHELRVRSWQPGDRISLGSMGSKKLSDLFIDSKVPAPYRPWIPVIERAGEIIAVVELFVAPVFRPREDEETAIELQLFSDNKDCGCAMANTQSSWLSIKEE